MATERTDRTYSTRVGDLTFTHDFAPGYPTDGTIATLSDRSAAAFESEYLMA